MEFMESDVFKVPSTIPGFHKRTRRCSRLTDSWASLAASVPDDLYDDVPFCSKGMRHSYTPVARDFTLLHAHKLSTSTPSIPWDKNVSEENDVSTTFSNCMTLSTSRDSGRFSFSSSAESDSALPLPRLSLESEFDKACSTDCDSAYDSSFSSQSTISECFSQTSELDLTSSTASLSRVDTPDNAATFTQLLRTVTPSEPDRLIGRHIGREHVDIIRELSVRNMSSVLFQVMSYVRDEDLCSICCVSKEWKSACENDKCAIKRRTALIDGYYQHRIQLQKENITVRKKKTSKGLTSGNLLAEIQYSSTPTQVTDKSVAALPQAQQFWQEASQLRNDESLRKCPKCSSPSRTHTTQERGVCTKCSHDFCIKCLRVFHGGIDCSITIRKKSKTDSSVGSKRSKCNLRRL